MVGDYYAAVPYSCIIPYSASYLVHIAIASESNYLGSYYANI